MTPAPSDPPPPDLEPATALGRRVRRRDIGLPSGRASVGGLLVALAALATWHLAAGPDDAPLPRYVIAGQALGPGHRLTAADLRSAPADLPTMVARAAIPAAEAPIGRTLDRRIATGELVTRDALRPAARRDLIVASIAVDPDWALAGQLQPGDEVSVLATFGEGTGATTIEVVRDAVVSSAEATGGSGIGEAAGQVLTLAFATEDDLVATVNAARAGTLTVARTPTRASRSKVAPYRTADHLPTDRTEAGAP